jgi:hypothetical protein
MSDTPQQLADVETMEDIIDKMRDLRARNSVKRSKTDPLYHAFCHAIHDVNRAIDLIQEPP